jgi:hypothetical protein
MFESSAGIMMEHIGGGSKGSCHNIAVDFFESSESARSLPITKVLGHQE